MIILIFCLKFNYFIFLIIQFSMKKPFIAVFDSGIGGLSVLKSLVDIMPNENYVYYGDNENVPYGNKSKSELISFTMNALIKLKLNFNLKAVVIGCNTISMTVLDQIKRYMDIPVFGVFPPVVTDGAENTLLLSTERTAEEYKKYNLNICVSPQPKLARVIEDNILTDNGFNHSDIIYPKNRKFERVILGCTHYFFIKNKILDHLKPLEILSGDHYTAKFVKNYLKNIKLLDISLQNHILFYGAHARINEKVWQKVVNDAQIYDKKIKKNANFFQKRVDSGQKCVVE